MPVVVAVLTLIHSRTHATPSTFSFKVGEAKLGKFRSSYDTACSELAKDVVRPSPKVQKYTPHSYFWHLNMSVAAFGRLWRCLGAKVLEKLWEPDEDVRLKKELQDAAQAVRDLDLADLLSGTPSASTEAVMTAVCQLILPRNNYSQTPNWREKFQGDNFKGQLLNLKKQFENFAQDQNQAEKNATSIGGITHGLIQLARLRQVVAKCKQPLGDPTAPSTVESRFVRT